MSLAQNDYDVEYDASDIQRALDDMEEDSPDNYREALKEDPVGTGVQLAGFTLYGSSLTNIFLSGDKDDFDSVQAPEHIKESSPYSGEIYEMVNGMENVVVDFMASTGGLEQEATVAAGVGGLSLMGAGLARSYQQSNQDSVEQDLRSLKQELEE